MVTMEEIARLVNNYAPRLDEVEKVKFSMFIHNQFAKEENLNDLNLANEWNRFVSDVFTCLDCYSHFNKNEGILTDNQGHQEFTCNPCSTKSACGACGELSNPNSHNCSEETQLVTCADCFADFDPFTEGKIHDKFSAPNLGGAVVAFCGKCWKIEITRRNGGK